jgi:predicted transcriptional regulator of viral defense system
MSQRFTSTDTAVIARARRKRREVLILPEDDHWLREYSTSPKDMLSRMARRGALIALGAGRYTIPVLGSEGVEYKPWQPLLHARLSPLGEYYLGCFSALEEHRLTDLSERMATVVVGFGNRPLFEGKVEIAGRPVEAARTRRPVFGDELGIELIRMSRTERYLRSNPTRTLVDCAWHQRLAGAAETWVTAWGRGARREILDPAAACKYACAIGPSVARRVGFLLELLGHGDLASELIPSRVRRADRSTRMLIDGPVTNDDVQRDRRWNVDLNVDRDRLEGWLLYGK